MTRTEAVKLLKDHKKVEEEWNIEENRDLIVALGMAIESLEGQNDDGK